MKNNFIELRVQSLEKQLALRLEKLWKIFSWTSSLLVAITAGLIAISRSHDFTALRLSECVFISAVIITLAVYAYYWLNENLRLESVIRDELQSIFKEEIGDEKQYANRPDQARFGYKVVSLLLGMTALLTTWWSYFIW